MGDDVSTQQTRGGDELNNKDPTLISRQTIATACRIKDILKSQKMSNSYFLRPWSILGTRGTRRLRLPSACCKYLSEFSACHVCPILNSDINAAEPHSNA